MTRRAYNAAELQLALAEAEAKWAASTWATAGIWKRTVHELRDRLSHVIALEAIK